MRFLVASSPRALERAQVPVRGFLVFTVLLVVAAMGQRWAGHGLSTEGLEDLFADAREPGGALRSAIIWEGVHTSAFIYGFLLLALGSLLAVCPLRPGLRGAIVIGALIAALGDMLLPFAAFRIPGWAILRIGCFATLSALLLVAIGIVWATLGRRMATDA